MSLTLSRKIGETIVIGDVVIEYASRKGDRVRLRIAAPPEVKVRRGELPALTTERISHEEDCAGR